MGTVAKTEENPIVAKLTGKLRKEIADLIPEDYLKEMVEKEVKAIETKEVPKLIKEEARKQLKERTETLVSKYVSEYCGIDWETKVKLVAKSELDNLIRENIGNVFTQMITAPIVDRLSLLNITPSCNNCGANNWNGNNCSNCGNYQYF